MWCIVNLPNGTQQAVKWDPKAMGQECLEKVCKALGIICEMEYFGLEHWTPNRKESRTREWINLRNRLTHDGSSGSSSIQLMLALRVKFWVPVHFILQESVRNLFYMQAKVDLIEGRLNARDWSNAAKLSALLCQADGIRYNESALKSKCPIRMKKEQELNSQQSREEKKEKKDKEYVLSFKKRRLSKQKSIEKFDNPAVHLSHNPMVRNDDSNISSTSASASASASASSSSSSSSSSTPVPSSSDGGVPSMAASCSTSSHSSTSTSTNKVSNANTSMSNANTTATTSTNATPQQDATCLENSYQTSPLRIYEDYIIQPADTTTPMPDDFLREIAIEHGKLATLQMTPKSAKYWLLQEIQELPGYGEEVFNGMIYENSVRCDITVGAHGIVVCAGDEKKNIPFSAIAAAKSFRRSFKLEYVDDHNDRKDLDIKLPKNNLAGGLYRSITERHAFYVCDKVRGVVTNQFTRDLKGTIASMFKDDTKLGKRYVFDIQRTCREVHDQARRTLHERGIEITAQATSNVDDIARYFPMTSSIKVATAAAVDDNNCGGSSSGSSGVVGLSRCTNSGDPINRAAIIASGCISVAGKVDLAIREKEEREAAIERCVDTRISEAMTCKICMDRAINTMFNPCCHVMACSQCAARCTNCPNCRVKISSVVKIYLPPELRTNQFANSSNTTDTDQTTGDECTDGEHRINATTISTPKITTAA